MQCQFSLKRNEDSKLQKELKKANKSEKNRAKKTKMFKKGIFGTIKGLVPCLAVKFFIGVIFRRIAKNKLLDCLIL